MSPPINIEFYGRLNDLLAPAQRDQAFNFSALKSRSVKDLIESLGVPHTEIGYIIANATPVAFEHTIHGGERLRVYPPEMAPEHGAGVSLQPVLPEQPRFILDVHLGKLAAYLRLFGFDTLYRNDYDDPELAQISQLEQRILLTCDVKLLMRKQVAYGYLVRARKPRRQLVEVIQRYNLMQKPTGDVRCVDCNGIIREVDKAQIESRLQPLTKKHYQEFYQCDGCNKIYWKGSHFDHMQGFRAHIGQQISRTS